MSSKEEFWVYCPRCGHKVLLELTLKGERVLRISQTYHTRLSLEKRERLRTRLANEIEETAER